METYKVLLMCGTVGYLQIDAHAEDLPGSLVVVLLHDENGNKIAVKGIVEEVLA
jgi:hypothetical protein